MAWLKATFEDERLLASLLERIVADSRRLPAASRAQVHVGVDPLRRVLYCDAAALALLNALIVLDHLDEVATIPEAGVTVVVPEPREAAGDAAPAAPHRREVIGDEASRSASLPLGLIAQPV